MFTLIQLAKEILVEEDRQSTHKIQRLVQILSRGAQEIGIDITAAPKTVFLKPNSYNCIDAPNEMYNWTKVGICSGGQVFLLTQNNALCFPHMTDDCGNLLPERGQPSDFNDYSEYASISGFGSWFYNVTAYNEYGELNAKMFGLGAGYNRLGSFKYNEDRRQFVLSPELASKQIALEYVPLPGHAGSLIVVPPDAREAMINFGRWKTAKTLGERNEFKADYYVELTKLQQRSFSFSIEDFILATREGIHQAAKE